jgi:imidazolonepropionase-like amidohydrolase
MLMAPISCHQAAEDGANRESSRALLLKDFEVVPMTSVNPVVLKNMSVVVRNGVIQAIGPSTSIEVPRDVLVIEGKGRTLMPGLIDMHVHVWDEAELFASNLTREAYESILEEARSLGMTIMGYTPEGIRESGMPHKKPFNIDFRDVIDDGFVTIEHMESIIWNGLADSLDEDKARKLAKSIARAGVVVDPTLVAHRNLVEFTRSDGEFLSRDGVETLNPFIAELEQETFQFWSSQPHGAKYEYDAFYKKAVRLFHEEGVMLAAGTDAGIFTNLPGR